MQFLHWITRQSIQRPFFFTLWRQLLHILQLLQTPTFPVYYSEVFERTISTYLIASPIYWSLKSKITKRYLNFVHLLLTYNNNYEFKPSFMLYLDFNHWKYWQFWPISHIKRLNLTWKDRKLAILWLLYHFPGVSGLKNTAQNRKIK